MRHSHRQTQIRVNLSKIFINEIVIIQIYNQIRVGKRQGLKTLLPCIIGQLTIHITLHKRAINYHSFIE